MTAASLSNFVVGAFWGMRTSSVTAIGAVAPEVVSPAISGPKKWDTRRLHESRRLAIILTGAALSPRTGFSKYA
jgi:hypothetical protein